jgi:glutamate racemase
MALKIGLFDSGLGGLTVVREVKRQLPEASVEFLGDNGRNPYGPRPREEIVRFSRQILDFLAEKGIDLAIIACNTATAAALSEVQEAYPFPVLGVIEPGARAALAVSKNRRIGVIGTQFTIESGAYNRTLQGLDPGVQVLGQACPLFTPLVEQGKTTGPEVEAAAREYLETFRGSGIDTLVLGCTHYPVLLDVIRRHLDPGIIIVDPAAATVAQAKSILETKAAPQAFTPPTYRFYTSGEPELFARLGSNILGQLLEHVERVAFPA